MKQCINPQLALYLVRCHYKPIAFDTETTGLTVKDKVCGYVITNEEYSIYVPVRHEGGGNIPNVDDFERELSRAFSDRGRLLLLTVGHNLGFDLRVCLRHGIVLKSPLEDTMINEAIISDITPSYSLDECCIRRKVTPKKGDELYAELARRFGGLPDRKQMGKFFQMEGDHPLVVDYATGDGISTLELWAKQQPILDNDELRKPWQLECDLLPYVARIHNRGLKIDPEYAEKVVGDVEETIKEKSKVFVPGFNVRSPKAVEALYRANGFTDEKFAKTDGGAFSFTEKWLETNDIGHAILSVRRLEKARDSFITPLIDTHNVAGRVHPILNQSKSDDYGVAGVRFSCSEPNLQAFPKRNIDVGRVVRRLVVPDEGFVIEEADAKQQEPRLFTHYSGDPALVDGYRSGTMDIHDRASAFLGLDRETAKRMAMGMLTMMSPPTLAGHMRWDIEKSRAAHKAFLTDAFPAIKTFQDTAIHTFRRRGYVKTLLGRRAYLDDPRFAYRAVSRIIQNVGGEHLKLCLLKACKYEDAYPDDIQILLTIHDSLLWQRNPSHDPVDLIRGIEYVAEELGLAVPIPFGLGSGKDWARASYGDKLDKYEDE
jgi:DNA polymerase I-like protein with 3'-5' exonuclease and polymerase domains